jgi:hypothetical protein
MYLRGLNISTYGSFTENNHQAKLAVSTIDLVLIDQQSVGKRSLHLMDTVKAKKRWTTIYWRVNKLMKESHTATRPAKKRASFLKINDI